MLPLDRASLLSITLQKSSSYFYPSKDIASYFVRSIKQVREKYIARYYTLPSFKPNDRFVSNFVSEKFVKILEDYVDESLIKMRTTLPAQDSKA